MITRRAGVPAVVTTLVAVALAVSLAACGGSSSTEETSTSGASATTGSSPEDAQSVSSNGGSDVAAAKKILAPYIGHPSPFPVTEKLKEVPKGATIDYMDCGTPVCALFWELLEPAAQTMGIKLERVRAGQAANTVASAFETALAQKPSAVIVGAIPIELWERQGKEIQEAGIPIVTTGILGTEELGITAPLSGAPEGELVGKLLANYVLAEMDPGATVAVYDVPEIPVTGLIAETFSSELEAICAECSVRAVHIPAKEIGTTSPGTIVSDLQANPDSTVAVFASEELQTGLPAALQAAGIEVETLGFAPTPSNLQYMKEGKETAALGLDLPVVTWTMLDQAAREIVGQKLTGLQAEGLSVNQFLRPEDITFDPSKGWTGYPNYAEMFAELWGVEG